MKLNKKFQYGLLLVFYLLRSGRTSLDNVAQNLGLSREFLYQVANQLKRAGVIVSKKGPGGGYAVVKDMDGDVSSIVALNVLQALGYTNSIVPDNTRAALRRGTVEQRALADLIDATSAVLYKALTSLTLQETLSLLSTREVKQMDSATEDAAV